MKKQPKSRKTSRTNPEWTATMIAKARPAREVLPKAGFNIVGRVTPMVMINQLTGQKKWDCMK